MRSLVPSGKGLQAPGRAGLGCRWVMLCPQSCCQPHIQHPAHLPITLNWQCHCRPGWDGDSVSCVTAADVTGKSRAVLARADAGPKQAGSAGWLNIHGWAGCQGKSPHCATCWSSPRKLLAPETSLSEAGRVTALN